MKTKLNAIFLLVGLVLLSLACGGGSGSESAEVSTQSSTIRVKGLSAGDVLKAYTLDGTMVDSSSASSTGDGSLSIPTTDYSVRVVLEVDGVALFETLVSQEELAAGNVSATLNAASTVMSRYIDSSFSTIYSAEYAAVQAAIAAAAAASNDSSGPSTSTAGVTDLISAIPSEQRNFTATVSFAYSSNLGFSSGDNILVTLSSSGTLFVDNQSVAAGYQRSEAGQESYVYWDIPNSNPSAYYQAFFFQNELLGFYVYNANDSFDRVYFSLPWSQAAKPRSEAVAMTFSSNTLSGVYAEAFGSAVTSLTNFSLSESSSISGLAAEIEMYTYLSAMALRVADEGTLSSTGWSAILDAVDAALLSETTENAKALADLIQSYLSTSTAITTSDFGTEMAAFLGDSQSVADKLTTLQNGDTAGALALIVGASGTMNSASALSAAESALVAENVLEAYEYASLAVSLDPTNDQARLVSAITRMITVGVKNNSKVKAFQQAANLEYTFIGNDALETRLDADEPEAGTVYDDAETVTGLPTLEEINTFVQDVYYSDIMDSIADLEAIDLTSFAGYTLTVAMQGYDEETMTFNASSDVEFDALDIKTILASMYLLKSKTEGYLAHNLSVSGVNDTQANMLDLAEDAFNEDPKVTGTATMAMSWQLEVSPGVENSDSIVDASLSLKGGFPGQIFVTNFTGDDGSPLELFVYEWDDQEQYSQVFNHPGYFDSSQNGGITFAYAFDGDLTRTVNGVTNHYFFEGGMSDINGTWNWTITVNGTSHYHVSSTPSGTLAKSSTQSEITDATAQSWINSNSSFLTTTEAYVTKTRESLQQAAEMFNDVINEFQLLDPMESTEARENNLVATADVEFEFDNMVPMTDSEIDNFQFFAGDLVSALFGATTVNPTFMSSEMESTIVDLSVLNVNTRSYMTDSSDQAILVDGALEADEDEIEFDLATTIPSSGNLFGMTALTYGGNVSELYMDAFDHIEEWLENGSTTFTRDAYIPESFVTDTTDTTDSSDNADDGSSTGSLAEISLITALGGTYTVTSVDQGSFSESTVTISEQNGDITLGSQSYPNTSISAIYDRLFLDPPRIPVDYSSLSERVDLYVNSSGELTSIQVLDLNTLGVTLEISVESSSSSVLSSVSAPTTMTGSTSFSWFETAVNGTATDSGTMTFTAGSVPGTVTIVDGSETFTGYINGLTVFLTTKNTDYEDTYVFTFTDTTFSEAVYLNTYKTLADGSTGADVGQLTKVSGDFALSGDLGPTSMTGSAADYSDTYYAIGGNITDPNDSGTESITLSSGSGSYNFFADAQGGSARLYSYNRMFSFSKVESDGSISIAFGAFTDDTLQQYVGVTGGLDASDTMAFMDVIRGTKTGNGVLFSHTPGYDYSGSTLSYTSSSSELLGSGTRTETFSMTTDSTDEETLSLTVDSTAISANVFQAGPAVMVPYYSTDTDFSFNFFLFDDGSLTDFTGFAVGVDDTGIWADVTSGTDGSGTKDFTDSEVAN